MDLRLYSGEPTSMFSLPKLITQICLCEEGLCVWMCTVYMLVCVHMCACMLRPESTQGNCLNHTSASVVETGFLIEASH